MGTSVPSRSEEWGTGSRHTSRQGPTHFSAYTNNCHLESRQQLMSDIINHFFSILQFSLVSQFPSSPWKISPIDLCEWKLGICYPQRSSFFYKHLCFKQNTKEQETSALAQLPSFTSASSNHKGNFNPGNFYVMLPQTLPMRDYRETQLKACIKKLTFFCGKRPFS